MSIELRIRDARPADCAELSALCMRSKAHWGYDSEFMRRCEVTLRITPAELQATTVRVAETTMGRLLGVAALESLADASKPKEAEVGRLFVEPEFMGQGVGRALLNDLRKGAQAAGLDVLWILADPQAEPFYLRMGAVREGMRPSDAIPGRMLPWLRLDLAQRP